MTHQQMLSPPTPRPAAARRGYSVSLSVIERYIPPLCKARKHAHSSDDGRKKNLGFGGLTHQLRVVSARRAVGAIVVELGRLGLALLLNITLCSAAIPTGNESRTNWQ